MVNELFYDQDLNRFTDADGEIIHDIHRYLDPWQIAYVKDLGATNCYVVIENKHGDPVEVFFIDTLGDDEMFWDIYDDIKENGI